MHPQTKLGRLRLGKGLTALQFSDAMKQLGSTTNAGRLYRIESGQTSPTRDERSSIAAILGESEAVLFDGVEV